MAQPPPIVAEMSRVIKDLRGQINSGATQAAQDFRAGRNQTNEAGPNCHACRGNGYAPEPTPGLSISKCRSCNGTGTLGKAIPVIERLWYEIDRLHTEMNNREREWGNKLRNESPWREPPSPSEETGISDRDVWLHILGINGDPSPDAVKKAYQQKAIEHHPDKGGSSRDFRMVKMAYDKLSGVN